jgi:hypothetical protein
MACVYVLHLKDSKEIRYVGISNYDAPEKRFKEHLKNARGKSKNGTWPVYGWIRKHYDDVAFTLVMSNLTWEAACEQEIKLIAELADGHDLLNCTSGGEGRLGVKHSPEARKKMSEAAKNNLTPERRIQLSEATKGKSLSTEHKAKISQGVKKAMTHDVREKISESSKKRMTPERRAGLSQAMLGRYVSQETREKHRAAAIAQHARKKACANE